MKKEHKINRGNNVNNENVTHQGKALWVILIYLLWQEGIDGVDGPQNYGLRGHVLLTGDLRSAEWFPVFLFFWIKLESDSLLFVVLFCSLWWIRASARFHLCWFSRRKMLWQKLPDVCEIKPFLVDCCGLCFHYSFPGAVFSGLWFWASHQTVGLMHGMCKSCLRLGEEKSCKDSLTRTLLGRQIG